MSGERIKELDALRERVATAPATTPEQRAARDKLLAELDREKAGVAADEQIRKDYAQCVKAEEAATADAAAHRKEVLADQAEFEKTVAALEKKYGTPLNYGKLSAADRAAYDTAYARYKKSWDVYAADRAAQKKRTERAAILVEQWRLQKLAFPDLYKGSSIATPCLPCLAKAIGDFEKTLLNPIVWIKIIDGPGHVEGNAEAPSAGKGNAVQIVNAPAIAEVVALFGDADAIKPRTIDRLGRKVKLRVKFRYARQENFTWAAMPDDTITYTAAETKRHKAYLNKADYLKKAPFEATTDGDGVAELEFEIGPASTSKWFFRAWDKLGGHDDSATLEAWKLVVIGHAKMKDLDTKLKPLKPKLAQADPGDAITKLNSYFKPHKIAIQLHSEKPITYARNTPPDESDPMQNEAVAAFQTELTKFGKCFMVLIEGHGYMDIGAGTMSATRVATAADIILPMPADSYSPGPIKTAFLKSGKTKVTVDASVFTIGDSKDGRNMFLDPRQAELDALWTAAGKTGTFATLEMTYRTAEPGAAGFASSRFPAVCVTRETPYERQMGPTMLAALIIHEMGHQLGLATYTGTKLSETTSKADKAGTKTAILMRPYLRKNLLDHNINIYEARGHQGPHCHHGTAMKPKYDGTETGQDCAMFGQMQGAIVKTGEVLTVKPTYQFCEKCLTDTVRLDMKLVSMGA